MRELLEAVYEQDFLDCSYGLDAGTEEDEATASTVRAHLERRNSLGGRRTGKKHAHAT